MRLLVLAGGFGSRLKTVVADIPKALAPIGEIPFLHLQIENWIKQGLNEFTFLLHHQADQIIAFLQQHQHGLFVESRIDWLIESEPMDTGGSLALAVKTLRLQDDFLITNADTWLGSGIEKLINSTSPAMAVVNLPDVSRYGEVHFDQAKHVTAFIEKTEQLTAGWVNAGLYHLNPALFYDWDGQPFSLERKLITKLVQSDCLTAVPLQTDFIDIGEPNDYFRFCRWVAEGRKNPICS